MVKNMEYEDLYDKNFTRTGKKIRRRIDEVPEDCYIIASYAIIKNNNKYLLEQATARSNYTLAIPGGHVQAGEDGITGLKRELKEELDLEPKNIKHLETILYPYKNYIFNIYLIEESINTEEIKYDSNEVLNIDWYTKNEIKSLIKQGKVNRGYTYILEKYIN